MQKEGEETLVEVLSEGGSAEWWESPGQVFGKKTVTGKPATK